MSLILNGTLGMVLWILNTLEQSSSNVVHSKESILLAQVFNLSFELPGTIVHLVDNFPFWAKILTDITPTYYRFWKLISYLKSRTLFISFIRCYQIFDIFYHLRERE